MTQPLTDQQLADIEARASVATDGPWERYEKYGPDFFACTSGSYLRGVGTFNFGDGTDADADEEFVKHAVQDVRTLVDEVRRLRDENAQLRAARDVIASLHRDVDARLDAVAVLCDREERSAARWEQPIPVPEWVNTVRAAMQPTPEPASASVRPVPAPEAPGGLVTAETAADGHTAVPAVVETGDGPCGHDDYHDPHEWADRPGTWCPGHSLGG